MITATGVDIRPATDADLPAILDLLGASLGWAADERHAAYFRWKHHDNPFGRSPMWVACDGGRVAGLRAWLPWVFEDAAGRHRAVRAVDTATHPGYRGRGIFRRLTEHSLHALRADGVEFVFNTPNDRSRPGYRKMGWQLVGRLPVSVRVRSPRSALRTLRARVPADRWSAPCDAGVPAAQALADSARVRSLLAARAPAGARLRTCLDPGVLSWRYGFAPLHYRAVADDGGLAVFRLRRRGPATEAVLCLVLAADPASGDRLVDRVARHAGADHLLRLGQVTGGRRFVPLPGQGPVLAWRGLDGTAPPGLGRWELSMGDIELL